MLFLMSLLLAALYAGSASPTEHSSSSPSPALRYKINHVRVISKLEEYCCASNITSSDTAKKVVDNLCIRSRLPLFSFFLTVQRPNKARIVELLADGPTVPPLYDKLIVEAIEKAILESAIMYLVPHVILLVHLEQKAATVCPGLKVGVCTSILKAAFQMYLPNLDQIIESAEALAAVALVNNNTEPCTEVPETETAETPPGTLIAPPSQRAIFYNHGIIKYLNLILEKLKDYRKKLIKILDAQLAVQKPGRDKRKFMRVYNECLALSNTYKMAMCQLMMYHSDVYACSLQMMMIPTDIQKALYETLLSEKLGNREYVIATQEFFEGEIVTVHYMNPSLKSLRHAAYWTLPINLPNNEAIEWIYRIQKAGEVDKLKSTSQAAMPALSAATGIFRHKYAHFHLSDKTYSRISSIYAALTRIIWILRKIHSSRRYICFLDRLLTNGKLSHMEPRLQQVLRTVVLYCDIYACYYHEIQELNSLFCISEENQALPLPEYAPLYYETPIVNVVFPSDSLPDNSERAANQLIALISNHLASISPEISEVVPTPTICAHLKSALSCTRIKDSDAATKPAGNSKPKSPHGLNKKPNLNPTVDRQDSAIAMPDVSLLKVEEECTIQAQPNSETCVNPITAPRKHTAEPPLAISKEMHMFYTSCQSPRTCWLYESITRWSNYTGTEDIRIKAFQCHDLIEVLTAFLSVEDMARYFIVHTHTSDETTYITLYAKATLWLSDTALSPPHSTYDNQAMNSSRHTRMGEMETGYLAIGGVFRNSYGANNDRQLSLFHLRLCSSQKSFKCEQPLLTGGKEVQHSPFRPFLGSLPGETGCEKHVDQNSGTVSLVYSEYAQPPRRVLRIELLENICKETLYEWTHADFDNFLCSHYITAE